VHADRPSVIQACRQSGILADSQTYRKAYMEWNKYYHIQIRTVAYIGNHTYMHAGRQAGRLAGTHTGNIQTYIQTETYIQPLN